MGHKCINCGRFWISPVPTKCTCGDIIPEGTFEGDLYRVTSFRKSEGIPIISEVFKFKTYNKLVFSTSKLPKVIDSIIVDGHLIEFLDKYSDGENVSLWRDIGHSDSNDTGNIPKICR